MTEDTSTWGTNSFYDAGYFEYMVGYLKQKLVEENIKLSAQCIGPLAEDENDPSTIIVIG